MKNKTLVKCKIKIKSDGKGITLYFYKTVFLWFGFYYPYGSIIGTDRIDEKVIEKINDKNISLYLLKLMQWNLDTVKPRL